MDKFPSYIIELAEKMAVDVNGGEWNKDYTDAQKIGWCLKIQWVMNHFDELTTARSSNG